MYFGKLCSRRYSESSFFFNTQIRNSFATIANVSVFHLVHVLLDYRLAYLRINIDVFTYPFNIGILFFRHLPIASEKDVQVVNTNVMCRQIRAITAFVNQIQNVQEE